MTSLPPIGILQADFEVGNIAANADLIISGLNQIDAALLVTSELSLVGYPPSDYVTTAACSHAVSIAIDRICEATVQTGKAVLVGAPRQRGSRLTNSMLLIESGQIIGQWDKQLLPFYDVFDDPRWFVSGVDAHGIDWRGYRLGVLICEDAWADALPGIYTANPIDQIAGAALDFVIVPTASPFEVGKQAHRITVMAQVARRLDCPVIAVNQVGYQDDMVFDGGSFWVDHVGVYRGGFPQFSNTLGCLPLDMPVALSDMAEIEAAIKTGVAGYLKKTGFNHVVLGLSGGIDSAVTATLAVDALGSGAITALALPTHFSSSDSLRDAQLLAHNLGITVKKIDIAPIYELMCTKLEWAPDPVTVGMENLQSRIRGTLVMGVANAQGALALSTGNKSELAMGYCTLYGDMNGALAPLSDVYKSQVFNLARWLNRDSERIPTFTITRPPSAELRPNQIDEDSLPPYPVLDGILRHYLEDQWMASQITAQGFDPQLVNDVIRRCQLNEYKRRQSVPGIKLSRHAFGRGRRLPIVARLKAV